MADSVPLGPGSGGMQARRRLAQYALADDDVRRHMDIVEWETGSMLRAATGRGIGDHRSKHRWREILC
jgi:hypothetical protein